MKGPLGLVLTGGGALGAWEAGFLDGLLRGGLRFERVLGYSSGALAGAAHFLGAMPELLDRWHNVSDGRILRFAPCYSPFSLFSGDPLHESVQVAHDDENAKRLAAFDFTVVTVNTELNRPAYHRFAPQGAWDGPLAHRLIASSSIPVVFPPVEINGAIHIDGGIPTGEALSFQALAGCGTVLIVEMVQIEERGRKFWNPWIAFEQKGREAALNQVEAGIASLKKLPSPPKILRLAPSKVLEFTMLDFKNACCVPAVDQGLADAKLFLN